MELQALNNDLAQLDVETFEIEDINDIGLDAPVIEGEEILLDASSCCSCTSSCCSSCSSTCSS